jgi:hypothetical protein
MSDSKLFTGIVETSNAGTCAVTVVPETYGGVTTSDMGYKVQGKVLSHTLATYFGFTQSMLPQPGSRVLCMEESGGACLVIGIIPQETIIFDSLSSRAMLGAKNSLADSANRHGHGENTILIMDGQTPADVVDGEHVISNELGVLLGLYQQMANLKASELAQIQCFLLDDLVRIISHNFQHYTAVGEHNIYHDGKRLMAEFGATHKASEMYGRPAVNSDLGAPIFAADAPPTVDDKTDYYKINEDEQIKAVERFKVFLGSVGDFIHLFLTRPDPEEVRTLNPDSTVSTPDTGLCDVHVGSDGGIHLRSVKEVFIEKTNWIRVPLRNCAPDDPKGDDAETLAYDKKKKFEFNDNAKYKGNPFNYALQIRDYVAYVNEKLGYQNFKSHKKDFYVNDDISKENKLSEFQAIDQETDLHQQSYQLRTAGIYLMPNGGITIRDAWNSAIVMEGGSIYLQPAKDLVSQPLRNLVTKVGGNISISSKKNIDLSSSEEGFRLKTHKAQYLYSHDAGVIIESNGSKDSAGSPDPAKGAVENIGGIVLKSKLNVYSYAQKNIVNYAKGQIMLQSLKNMDIVADKELTLYGKQSLQQFSDYSILNYAGHSITTVSDGSVTMAGATSTALGQKDQKLGVMYDKKSKFIDLLEGLIPVSEVTGQLKAAKKYRQNLLEHTVFQNETKFNDLTFKFLSSDAYKLNPEEDAMPATLAQQDDLLTSMYKLETWKEPEINNTLPYPGKSLFGNFYYSSEKPVNLEKNSLGKDYSNKADSQPQPANVSLGSLNDYKAQK